MICLLFGAYYYGKKQLSAQKEQKIVTFENKFHFFQYYEEH